MGCGTRARARAAEPGGLLSVEADASLGPDARYSRHAKRGDAAAFPRLRPDFDCHNVCRLRRSSRVAGPPPEPPPGRPAGAWPAQEQGRCPQALRLRSRWNGLADGARHGRAAAVVQIDVRPTPRRSSIVPCCLTAEGRVIAPERRRLSQSAIVVECGATRAAERVGDGCRVHRRVSSGRVDRPLTRELARQGLRQRRRERAAVEAPAMTSSRNVTSMKTALAPPPSSRTPKHGAPSR